MKRATLFVAALVGYGALVGLNFSSCDGDTSPARAPGNATVDQLQGWSCATGVSCQDVYDIEFSAGSTVTFQATETTGGSVCQIALYAPGVALGGINSFTGTTKELRCNFVSGCGNNTAGQSVTGFIIPADGLYRLAITRNSGSSCGGSGTYRLIIYSNRAFSGPTPTVDDVATLATGAECP